MTVAARRAACALFLLTLFVPSARAARIYDPDVEYFTLTTPNFYVMYPEGFGHIAMRTAQMAEDARPYFVRRYEWDPDDRISIVINDQTDFANGSATIFPSKVITLFVTAPTRISGLEEYDDWLATVLIHEMAHIFHLDMAYGLPWIGRLIFGKYVSMNVYYPGWVTEGFAVYEETVSSGAGRGRSTYVDMVLRTAALADRFPPIDQGYRGYPNWPFSNIAYFFGGRFQLWLREKYGEEALIDYHQTAAASPIPFVTYIPAKLTFDTSIESLWLAFEEESTAKAERDLELIRTSTLAVSEPRRLTFHGGESVGPRYTPDGRQIIYSTSSPVDGPRVRRMNADGSNDEALVNDTLSQAITFGDSGRAFYFQQTAINQRFYQHNSIYRYDLEKDATTKVKVADDEAYAAFVAASGSLRARDPDISPDGRHLVFVQTPNGANRLVYARLEEDGISIHPREIVPPAPGVQLAAPRFSPDGEHIVVARYERGRRDIVLYDVNGAVVRRLTNDRAQDTDPTFTPDGRWIVFSSDRTGIYNLYAYHLERDELFQLTNVATGAFQPDVAPDGRTVLFRGYSADGFDVYTLPFDPEAGVLVERAEGVELAGVDTTARAWPPQNDGAAPIPPPAPFAHEPMPDALPEDWSIDSYSALDTILPFNDNWNLFPSLQANEREIYGSLTHFGADARQTHSYVLSLTYGTFTNFVGGAAAYANDVLEPTFTVFGTADAVTYSNALFVSSEPTAPCPFGDQPLDLDDGRRICNGARDGSYNERRLRGQFSIGLPLLQRHFISASYIFERRDPLDALPDQAITSVLPRSGNFARVQLGYTYANVRAFPYSISLERGPSFGVALSALSKGLGSDYEQLLLTTEGRYYLSMPWRLPGLTNHVIATRLGLGIGIGSDRAAQFRLGGVAGSSAITTTTEDFYGLRGLVTSALSGTGLVSGSTEYRAPLFRVDRGIGTLPFVLRVFHAAAFVDYGRIVDDVDGALFETFADELAVSAGGELRADVILFYGLPLTVRGGYAHVLHRPTQLDPAFVANGFYFQLGSVF